MSERSAVQNPMMKYAQEIGWQYISPEEALKQRGGDTGLYLTSTLKEKLIQLNPGIVDHTSADEIIRKLCLLSPDIKGNRLALSWMRSEQSVYVPGEKRERNVQLMDFNNPNMNLFQVTDEWRQKGISYNNRADVIFLINGIPVAIAETKASTKSSGMSEGVDQIRRYHRETPEMFVATQVFEVTQLVDFFYGVTWNTSRKNLFNWKDEHQGNYESKVKAFFDRTRFLRLLHDYIIFRDQDDELSKVILRQHQTRAVEKTLERVKDPSKRRGLVWHTQGSGKTLTMITIASKLLRDTDGPGAEKPTVLMLVDRNELESQLFKNIAGYGITAQVAGSKRELQDILRSDYRGLVVSMIHKFDDIPANLNTRSSIVVLVDEAHRTTGGDLGNYLMAAIPNATYIGFTGTPVDNISKGKGTFKVFGGDDEQGYLDKYSIAESIQDGTTVSLNYSLAPSDLRVDRETLEEQFLNLVQAEGISDVDELNAILDRAVELKEMMKTPDRVQKIARFVAEHYTTTVDPMGGFKAFLVAVDREACVLYKKELDKLLPQGYTEVIYSPSHNDKGDLKDFYPGPDREKEIRKAFTKKDKLPKILIVTEKLLTGYDAPILYCLYLDKPMRDHVLLQTIARVNRPYEDEDGLVKPVGFVLDFVGIFEKLEKALAFDSDTVTSVIQNVDVLQALFATLMRETTPKYLPFTRGWDDKAKERAIEHFEDKVLREEFFKFFRQLQNLYDILSPDAFLRDFMDDYQALSMLYAQLRVAYTDRVYIDKELTEKTKALLRQHSLSGSLELPGAIHSLGAKELEALKGSDTSDTVKVLNLRKVLAVTVDEKGQSKPYLLSIGERAASLAQAYEDRQITTQQALFDFEKLAKEAAEAESTRQQMHVDANTFAIYTALRPVIKDVTAEQAININNLFLKYPDYKWDDRQRNQLRNELYKVLVPLKVNYLEVAKSLLKLQRV